MPDQVQTTWTSETIADNFRARLRRFAAFFEALELDLPDLPFVTAMVVKFMASRSWMGADMQKRCLQAFFRWCCREESPDTVGRNTDKLYRGQPERPMEGAMYYFLSRKLTEIASRTYKREVLRRDREAVHRENACALFDRHGLGSHPD